MRTGEAGRLADAAPSLWARLGAALPRRKAAGPPAEPMRFTLTASEAGRELLAQDFQAGDLLIGGSPANDIILADLDADEAAALRLEEVGAAGLVTLTALAGGVEARGRELEVGAAVAFPQSAAFRIGPYDFTVAHRPPAGLLASPSGLPVLLIAGSVLAAAAAILAGGIDAPPPRPAAPLKDTLDSLAAPSEAAAALEADLRLRLVSASLIPGLRVSRQAERVVIEGAASPDERARVIDLAAAFRDRAPAPIELRLDSREAAGFIGAVVLSPRAYVIGRDGAEYALEQRLPDGGVLEAIDETTILINRDGTRERLTYAR